MRWRGCAGWASGSFLGRVSAGLLGSVLGGAALAGALSVSPTRIELSARHPIATLEVRNEGADTVTIQLERLAWTQPDGQDVYSADTSLIATPTVFELAPHGSQTLRVALRDGIATSTERAYRLYASEVPAAQPISGSGLQMALRIGVPVFAASAASKSRLEGEILAQPGKRAVRLRNVGGHFTRAREITVRDSAGAVLWQTNQPAYLLAGGEYVWSVDSVPPFTAGERLQLSVITETGVENLDARLSP